MKSKPILLTLAALGGAAALAAFGVSPSQYTPSSPQGQPQPSGAPAPGGLQPAPQPSSNLMGGGAPMGNNPGLVITPAPVDYTQVPDWAKAWSHLSFEEAKAGFDDHSILFLDARAKVEYDQGHIPGALPLPQGEYDKYFPMWESKIKKAKKLVTYCHGAGCHLSNKVAQKLWEKGYKNVGSFFGGWPQWTQHNMPQEKGDAKK